MKDFQSFCTEILNRVQELLPPSYQEGECSLHRIQKLNESYTGLKKRKKDQTVSPAIKLDLSYQDYLAGKEMQEIAETICDTIEKISFPATLAKQSDRVLSYNSIKSKLFVRLSNKANNQELLERIPHRDYCDLSLSYHISLKKIKGQMASILINREMMEHWGIDEEKLNFDALENSAKLMPCDIIPIREVLEQHIAPIDCFEGQKIPLYVVRSKGWGSSAGLFYPGIMEKLAEIAKGDYYILPSSIHEVLMLPAAELDEAEKLKEMVKEINLNVVDASERLSDNVYYYNAEKYEFSMIE